MGLAFMEGMGFEKALLCTHLFTCEDELELYSLL